MFGWGFLRLFDYLISWGKRTVLVYYGDFLVSFYADLICVICVVGLYPKSLESSLFQGF
jgi:hypothetical protein